LGKQHHEACGEGDAANYQRVQALRQNWDQRSRLIILDDSHH